MNKLTIMKSVIIAMNMVGIAYANNNFSHSNTWTGFYAGVNAGVVFNDVQLKAQQLGFTNPSDNCNIDSHYSTFFPGLQLGYLYQLPNNLVSGIEANIAINTKQKNTLTCRSAINPNVYDSFSFRNQMQGAIKGRVGRTLSWNNYTLLPFLTAGFTFANEGLTYKNEGGDYYSKNNTQAGWLIGAGLEWAFRQDWSLRAEYFYANYGNTFKLKIPSVYGLIDPQGNARVGLSSNNVVVTINYWI